ncbi:uncharacterized protein FMAN_05482 [Fusarium mangiferae]|uniref:Uncharacterized protein n=1 Tax=Fusarium mangiferae TaxID=192010 RepID=A0A1L7SLZ2_FUSMA|nr:uncharacterized protein FMAN_05482 [Fusarium mangiferae]CVK87570.1 uncharacterized protein FMAN_05482 [Fusarium mangiferae]
MPKRRLSSDSKDDAPRKIRKFSNQQMEHRGNLEGTVSSLRRCSLSQLSNEFEPKTQLLTPERDLRSRDDEPTSLDEDFSSARADTDNSVDESSDDSDLEESLKSPRPESLQEMIDEIKKLKEIINSKTFMMKHWRDSAMLLDKEVEALKAKLEAVDKEPAQA